MRLFVSEMKLGSSPSSISSSAMGGGRGGGFGGRCAVCLLDSALGSRAGCCGVFDAPGRRAVVVYLGDCLRELRRGAVPRVPRGSVGCSCLLSAELQRRSASCLTVMSALCTSEPLGH
eukprot:scaffold6918_cov177-Isochrysis_galbana.AAC.1